MTRSRRVLGRNVVANAAGTAGALVFALCFVPVYIRELGPEAYGLVGLFVTLLALASVLDLGLSATLNRELARHGAAETGASESRRLVRVLQRLYWGVALLIGLVVWVAAEPIASHWLRFDALSHRTTRNALRWMAAVAVLQWPQSLYGGGLLGLERHVLYNAIKLTFAALRGGGAALVLLYVAPTIEAFFAWQLIAAALHTSCLAVALHRSLPRTAVVHRVGWDVLRGRWRFAAGVGSIALTTTVLTQLDKIVLTKLLPLASFGYYAFAATVGSAMTYLAQPFFQAFFPRLSHLHARGAEHELAHTYHRGCQWVAGAVVPVALTIAFFTDEVLLAWSGDPALVRPTRLLVRLLVLGWALNGLVTLPYAMQLAAGWTRLALVKTTVAIVLLVPALLTLVPLYGAAAAAGCRVALNLGYLLVEPPIMHRRLLRGELRTWWGRSVARPVLAGLAMTVALRAVVPVARNRIALVLELGAIYLLVLAAVVVVTPELRSVCRAGLRRVLPRA
ncbi:MAG: hypothetical protein D6776_10695 [Planctomycetota bacterium]|nr:MAG: hypothetical protein D6776_10695 [Planctomycetota bacterium]